RPQSPAGSASAPVVIARSTQPVVNGPLGQWIPSGPGFYQVALTVRDKAGNVRTRTTNVGWSSTPAIANLSVDPRFFSPNGDGVRDVAWVRYTALLPVTADFDVMDSSGNRVRTFTRTHLQPEESSFDWDGRNDSGARAADDVYSLRVEGTSFGVVLDTTPPEAVLALSKTLPPSQGSELAWNSLTALR